jgi:exodeoxyribonuclease V alpha subunit
MDATCRFFKRCVDAYGIENTMLLSPYRRATDICTNRLNKQLQETINPYTGQPEVSAKNNKFRLRDRVIQLRNTETLSNGDIGTVIQAYPGAMEDETCLTVEFESGVKQEYRKEDLNQLDLAYALTVHKSQGSQARAVVIILPCRFTSFLKRNVLYTAITRSSQYVAIFGPQETIASCILNDKKDERHTNLVARVREAVRTITTRKGAA